MFNASGIYTARIVYQGNTTSQICCFFLFLLVTNIYTYIYIFFKLYKLLELFKLLAIVKM